MLLRRFVRRTCGQDLIEYLLLGAFIAVVALAGLGSLGTSMNEWFVAAATFIGEDDAGSGSGSKSRCSATGMIKSGGRCQ